MFAFEDRVNYFLAKQKIAVPEYTKYASGLLDELKTHLEAFAEEQKIEIVRIQSPTRFNKELEIRKIIEREKITEGYVAILSAVEMGRSYKPHVYKSRLKQSSSPCQHYYIYCIDQTLGLTYVRMQTYIPFAIQIYLNGHNYLAQKLKKQGIGFQMVDNGFTFIENYEAAQKIVNPMKAARLKKIFDAF